MNGIRQMLSVMAPMRDGVKLSCDIRLPRGAAGPFPVVLKRNPYNKALAVTDSAMNAHLAAGWAYVEQDSRGKHESDGLFDAFTHDAQDGYDTVMWISRQRWCDGTVAMVGASYSGWTQLAAAAAAPKPLVAITPSVMGADPYSDIFYPGGVASPAICWWAINNGGRSQRADSGGNWPELFKTLPIRELDRAVGQPTATLQRWLDHPTRDEYWTASSVQPHFGEMTAAVLLAGGWYDIFGAGMVRAYCGISAARKGAGDVKLLMGPWTHGLAASRVVGDIDFGVDSLVDISRLKRRFLHAAAGTGPETLDEFPPVRIFVMGANEWRNENEFPPADVSPTDYYLVAERAANSMYGDGRLSASPEGAKGFDEFTYNPLEPASSIGGASLLPDSPAGPCDQRPVERRDDVLCYTSEVLRETVEAIGFVRVELFVSSSAVDTDFVAHLCDVYPDGRSIVLCQGVLRTRFRNGFDRQEMMTPGEVYRIGIDLGPTANAFLPGHRIRLEVSSSSFPQFARNLNTGGDTSRETDPLIARQKVHHSKRYPSRLILPVRAM